MTEELELFLEDADEQLEFMETALVDMQESGVNDEDIGALFRAMHTIKGTAGMFGFDDVVSFTHIAESLLSEVRDEKIVLSDDELDLFLKCKDHVEELVRLASQDEMMNNESRLIHGELSSKLKAKMFDSPAVENTKASLDELQNPSTLNDDIKLWQIDIKLLEEFYTSGMDIINIISFLKDLGTLEKVELITSEIPLIQNYQPLSAYIGFHIELSTDSPYEDIEEVFEFILDDLELNIIEKDSKEIVEKPVEVIASKEVYKKQKKESQEHKNFSLRVDSSKVDQLINQISEMVIANAKIAQRADELDDADLSESTLIMTDMLEEVRSSVMNVRMVQVGDSFSKFRRIVNDTAKKIGKSINFTINGGETELDKMVVEKISDPLMHMLRNSVDHGVEMPDEREASGKAKEGVVTLSAYPDAGTIVIEIKDDGKGLDRDKILSKAIANGTVKESDNLSDKEIYALIFAAGLSTADAVSDISGRGVGMDVVRRNIEELRGTVDIDSSLGKGSTFTIRLPLTLAIIDGFLIQSGDTKYIIPLEMIQECIELSSDYKEKMKGNEFIKRIRKYGKQHGMHVKWMAERGKGSHGTLYIGHRYTVVRNPKDELKTGTLNAMLKQLGLKKEDI